MKFTLLTITFLSTIIGQADAQLKWACGAAGAITAAGSTTVAPITNLSGSTYTGFCKNNTVTVSLGGSTNGAKRVCGDPSSSSGGTTPVDIGNMSRDWKPTEATSTDGINYKCVFGNTSRSVIKQAVAIDGISIVIERGQALDACFKLLEYSLTSAQLRWIFSNLTTLEVKPSIANADGDPSTRKWIELNAGCPDQAIKIAAPSAVYGTHDFFKEVIFTAGAAETFRSGVQYFNDNSPALRDNVLNNDFTIGFFGFAFYNQFDGPLQALAIDKIEPNKTTLSGDLYVPLGRRIFSNFLSDTDVLAKTKCFNDFHFTEAGKLVVQTTEFLPIPDTEWETLKKQVPGTCTQPGDPAPAPKPCKCFFLFKLLGLCCRKK